MSAVLVTEAGGGCGLRDHLLFSSPQAPGRDPGRAKLGEPWDLGGLIHRIRLKLHALPGKKGLCFSWHPLNLTATFGS